MEQSIGIISAVLTDIRSESREIRKRELSTPADGQTAHEKGKYARRGITQGNGESGGGCQVAGGIGKSDRDHVPGRLHPPQGQPSHWVCSIQQISRHTPSRGTKWPPPLLLGCVHRLQENISSVERLFQFCVVACTHPVSCARRHSFLGSSMSCIQILTKRTESLTAGEFKRSPTGDCLLLPWQT